MMSTTEVMLEFVRAAVFDRVPIIPEGYEIDWDKLQEISSEQGVLAWVWDGICKLPKEEQPPRIVRINFGMSAQEIWDRSKKQENVLAEMVATCRANDIRMLLLKGYGLARLYPKPESRPSGDIDFYLFEDYQKGNDLFSGENSKKSNKHSENDYQGVHVENHFSMLDTDNRYRKRIEKYLEISLNKAYLTSYGYYLLEPTSNLLYLLAHSIRHFEHSQIIPIRNIIDISFFIEKNKSQINPIEFKRLAEKFGIQKIFDLFLAISENLMHFDFADYRTYSTKNIDLKRIIQYYISDNQLKDIYDCTTKGELRSRFLPLWIISSYMPVALKGYRFFLLKKELLFEFKIFMNIPFEKKLFS
ncbi:MAG: nucleotidyltransferase family protein [Bacteroidales bacterium]|nr:nucleotidyltransferase family protein [Bacteroidales bacterium]